MLGANGHGFAYIGNFSPAVLKWESAGKSGPYDYFACFINIAYFAVFIHDPTQSFPEIIISIVILKRGNGTASADKQEKRQKFDIHIVPGKMLLFNCFSAYFINF